MSARCPAIDLVALPDVEMRSDWMPYVGEEVVGDGSIYPAYARDFYDAGYVARYGYPEVHETKLVSAPTYVITHFNMRTYGHFLLEVLPKLLLIRELYAMGLAYQIAFPASMTAFIDIARAAFPDARLLIYDDRRRKLILKTALLPSMMASSSGDLHDVAISALKLMSLRLASGAQASRRLFIVREGHPSFRVLTNEAEIAAIAQSYGFEPIRPETLPWSEQVAAFNSASHVIGEFTSALHNTMFSPASTKVISLNWMGTVQSMIAACAGQEIGYIMPEGGVDTSFAPGWTDPKSFEIDPGLFRERLDQIGLRPVAT